jgi:hypothetical protein
MSLITKGRNSWMRCHVIWSWTFDDAGTSINLLSADLNYNDFKITVFAGNSKKIHAIYSVGIKQ